MYFLAAALPIRPWSVPEAVPAVAGRNRLCGAVSVPQRSIYRCVGKVFRAPLPPSAALEVSSE